MGQNVVTTVPFGDGRAKRLANRTPGPWVTWRTKKRHLRAIRFIETYCSPAKGYRVGRPLKLARFQKEWLEEVYAPGINSAAMSVARGNGKSTFLAAVGLHATFDPDVGGAPQVPVVATTIGQALKAVYGVALDMVRLSPELGDRALVFTAWGTMKILVPSTSGEMFPISNDVDGLQGLDPSVAICDELGFMPVESWDSLLMASGKRPRSLVVGIGTPGLDKLNALWHLRQRVGQGEVPGFVFTEFAADEGCDVDDRAQWRQANPALAARYQSLAALETVRGLSEEGPFRVFRLGQWVDGVECWLGASGRAVWDDLSDPADFAPNGPLWLGVDAARSRDSTAVVAVQRRLDGRLHAKARIWIPEKGQTTDWADVQRHIRELYRAYPVVAVSYDPKFFDTSAQMLEQEGVPMVEIPQSLERMTPAVSSTYELIKQGQLTHDGDEVFATQVLNAVPRFNNLGFTLEKKQSPGRYRGRIDAAVALCLAVDRCLRAEPAEVDLMMVVA